MCCTISLTSENENRWNIAMSSNSNNAEKLTIPSQPRILSHAILLSLQKFCLNYFGLWLLWELSRDSNNIIYFHIPLPVNGGPIQLG